MKRFVLPAPPGPDGIVRLYEKDYHYLVRVRRLKTGGSFDAVLPGGAETRVTVLSTAGNTLTGECPEARKSPLPLPPLALFQALPKGAKMDLIVRQAAEGCISVIAPFESDFSAVRLKKKSPDQDGGGQDGKLKRWERIIKEARQQSGSVTETVIRPPCGSGALLEYWESLKKEYRRPLGILLHQDPLENGTFHGYLGDRPDFTALAVGPEGGFSQREVQLFLAAGFKPLLMGDTVLRTETAALYAAAAIRIILLEGGSWIPKPRNPPEP